MQKFFSGNCFIDIISKGAINFFRINLITTKYITTVASFYGFIFIFFKKKFMSESPGVESSGVESPLPMPLNILSTKSLT